MRLLFVTHKYPPQKGGVGVSARRIASGLAAWCDKVDVLHCTREGEPGMVTHREEGNLTVFTAAESDRAAESGQLLESTIRALHEARRYEAVVGFYAVPTGYVAVFTAALLGLPSLLCLRGNDLDRALYHPGQLASLQWALSHSGKVVAVSRELVAKARLVSGRSDIAFVGNSVDPREFFPSEGDKTEPGHLLFTGEMRLKKGSTPLLSCLTELTGDWRLTLAGGFRGQAEAEFRRFLLSSPKLAERVRTLPYSRDLIQLRELYHQADLVLSPALWDGMPNSVLEAMACGKPVLATDVGGVRDLIEDGRTGYLSKLSELDSLGQKVSSILSDPERHEVGRRARELVAANFSPEHEQAAYRDILSELLSRSNSRTRS